MVPRLPKTHSSCFFAIALLGAPSVLAQPTSEVSPATAPALAPSAESAPALPSSSPPSVPTTSATEVRSEPPLDPPGRPVQLRTPAPAPVVLRGRHVHDGFYFRFATGFGVYEEELMSEESDVYAGRIDGSTRGLGSLTEMEIGGSLRPGLVLGVGVYGLDLVTGTFRPGPDSADSPPSELDVERRSLGLLGPFLNWYPNPRRGFHLHGALGLAGLSSGRFERDSDGYRAFGAGLALGIGHDFWIGDEWSLGVMGRLIGAVVTGKDDANVRFVHALGASPSLLVNVTYN